MVINTNISSARAASMLEQSSAALSKSLARLSSGSKITSPADDSAGLGVSMNLNAQISRTTAAAGNVANALSFNQTQDGYLSQVGTALTRMSELSVQAQDVTKTTSDRALDNQEFQTLASYVNNVATKDFNGVSLFSSSSLNVTTDGDGGTFTMSGISADFINSTTLTTTSVNGNTKLSDLGVSTTDLANGIQMTLSDGNHYSQTFNSSSTINDLVNFLNSDSTPGTASASYNAGTGQLTMVLGPDGFGTNNQLDLQTGGDMLKALGLNPAIVGGGTDYYYGLSNGSHTYSTTLPQTVSTNASAMDISSVAGAASAQTQLSTQINQLASDRASIGASMERLNYTSNELETLKNNLSSASSQITDVDVASESTNYHRQNILVQAGTAVLAQANTMPQSVLRLLS